MLRNTQVTRILLVLRRLGAARRATLEELAQTLPAEYPKNLRATRRDITCRAAHGSTTVAPFRHLSWKRRGPRPSGRRPVVSIVPLDT